MCFLKKLHFSRFILRPKLRNLLKISSRCCRYSSSVLLKMIMSSKYPIVKLLHLIRTLSIKSWKYAGTWLSPKGVHLDCPFPIGRTNADLALDSLVSRYDSIQNVNLLWRTRLHLPTSRTFRQSLVMGKVISIQCFCLYV